MLHDQCFNNFGMEPPGTTFRNVDAVHHRFKRFPRRSWREQFVLDQCGLSCARIEKVSLDERLRVCPERSICAAIGSFAF